MEVVMAGFAPLAATGIGSVPFTDARQTVALILETLPLMPYWPQMVQMGFLEERPLGKLRRVLVRLHRVPQP